MESKTYGKKSCTENEEDCKCLFFKMCVNMKYKSTTEQKPPNTN